MPTERTEMHLPGTPDPNEIVVALRSFTYTAKDGNLKYLEAGQLFRRSHPAVKENPDIWAPMSLGDEELSALQRARFPGHMQEADPMALTRIDPPRRPK